MSRAHREFDASGVADCEDAVTGHGVLLALEVLEHQRHFARQAVQFAQIGAVVEHTFADLHLVEV